MERARHQDEHERTSAQLEREHARSSSARAFLDDLGARSCNAFPAFPGARGRRDTNTSSHEHVFWYTRNVRSYEHVFGSALSTISVGKVGKAGWLLGSVPSENFWPRSS